MALSVITNEQGGTHHQCGLAIANCRAGIIDDCIVTQKGGYIGMVLNRISDVDPIDYRLSTELASTRT